MLLSLFSVNSVCVNFKILIELLLIVTLEIDAVKNKCVFVQVLFSFFKNTCNYNLLHVLE